MQVYLEILPGAYGHCFDETVGGCQVASYAQAGVGGASLEQIFKELLVAVGRFDEDLRLLAGGNFFFQFSECGGALLAVYGQIAVKHKRLPTHARGHQRQ